MTDTPPRGRALVVTESMFGNTAAVGAAVAHGLGLAGLAVDLMGVDEAPQHLPDGLDLLVLGAPTHAFSLSRPATRTDAVAQGAPAGREGWGLREWLSALHPGTSPAPVAVFDTRVSKVRRLPMAAGPAARRLARAQGLSVVERPAYFLVDDVRGPLSAGELARAAAWGRHLGDLCGPRPASVDVTT